MKKNIVLFLVVFSCCFFMQVIATAQSWQWGIYAGSRNHTGKADNISALAVDKHGNTYMTVEVESKGLFAGPVALPDGKGANMHTLLLSHDCNGNYRWSKVIGGSNTQTRALRVNRDGQVYIFGVVGTTPIYNGYYDTDTMTPKVYQGISLVCYDTTGKFQWLRRPDTVTGPVTSYQAISMDMDEAGNTYCLLSMPPGNKITGSSLSIPATVPYRGLGAYVFKYSPSGILLSVTMLKDYSYTFVYGIHVSSTRITYNKFNGGFFLTGSINPTPGTDSLFIKGVWQKNNMFLAAFAADGSYKWHKTDTSVISGFAGIGSPVIPDASGNLYLSGSLPHTDMFNDFRALNPLLPERYNYMPFVMKTDSAGKLIWCVNGGALPSVIPSYIGGAAFAVNQNYAVIGGTGGLKGYFGDPSKDTLLTSKLPKR
jgi:hypothetical protein